jgi:hypothetical protein
VFKLAQLPTKTGLQCGFVEMWATAQPSVACMAKRLCMAPILMVGGGHLESIKENYQNE